MDDVEGKNENEVGVEVRAVVELAALVVAVLVVIVVVVVVVVVAAAGDRGRVLKSSFYNQSGAGWPRGV